MTAVFFYNAWWALGWVGTLGRDSVCEKSKWPAARRLKTKTAVFFK